jgi:tricarboxylate carrier
LGYVCECGRSISFSLHQQYCIWSVGRYRHFRETASVSNAFASKDKIYQAEKLIRQYREDGTVPEGTTEDALWKAKRLYDSSHHPETGEKIFIMGRMSFQAPGNMIITGLMNTYRSNIPQMFLQFLNQSFNAVVNFSNRGGDERADTRHLLLSFLIAVGTATTVAYTLPRTRLLSVKLKHYPMVERTVPLMAVISANAINIPLMRKNELSQGLKVVDEHDKKLTTSKVAARYGVSQTLLSRILLASVVMGLPAGIMYTFEKTTLFKIAARIPAFNPMAQIVLVGLSLVIGVPPCLAVFPQKGSLPVSSLEPEARKAVRSCNPDIQTVYYNKGL